MFGVGLIQGKDLLDMFLTAVSLAVAAIPEGLPAIVTIVLALGVGRMARRGAIVKKLPAVETLGCAGVICSDKTGTLTQNRMTVQQVWIPAGGRRREALLAGCLCSDARLEWRAGAPAAQGDPTEGALVVAAAREGLDKNKLEEEQPRRADLPFDSTRKLMSTVHPKADGGFRVYVKGAPDVLLDRCTAGPRGPLTAPQRSRILRANEEMAGQALRVLAVAERDLAFLPPSLDSQTLESGLTFLGLFGLMDPPRPEAKAAVALCHRAGVRPVMITGDHKATASAVARELDILRPGDRTLTGSELDFLPQELLEEDIDQFSVFARVSPEHKMRIVNAWQKKGKIVAMTGDGVNDAPALKAADIGCAMGRSGTDVAKGAAAMILTDDNFSTIVEAIEEGRGIYANIRKAIHYLLSCNIGEILTIFTATLLNFGQMPLVPVQLLWLNLVTDSLPALALGVEPVEAGVMEQPPRPADQGLFDKQFSLRLAWQGLMVGGLTLAAYFLGFTRLAAPGMEVSGLHPPGRPRDGGGRRQHHGLLHPHPEPAVPRLQRAQRGPLHLRPGSAVQPGHEPGLSGGAGPPAVGAADPAPPGGVLRGPHGPGPMVHRAGAGRRPGAHLRVRQGPLPTALRPGGRGGALLRHRPSPAESRAEVGGKCKKRRTKVAHLIRHGLWPCFPTPFGLRPFPPVRGNRPSPLGEGFRAAARAAPTADLETAPSFS